MMEAPIAYAPSYMALWPPSVNVAAAYSGWWLTASFSPMPSIGCIDGKIWDIKSASPYSFDKKFGEAGGFSEVARDDSFGYVSQGFLYSESQKKNFGGWIVVNKSTGEWAVCETPASAEEHKEKALNTAKDNYKAIKEGKPFKRCFSDVAETFRT